MMINRESERERKRKVIDCSLKEARVTVAANADY